MAISAGEIRLGDLVKAGDKLCLVLDYNQPTGLLSVQQYAEGFEPPTSIPISTVEIVFRGEKVI